MNGFVVTLLVASFAPDQTPDDRAASSKALEPPDIIRVEASLQGSDHPSIRRRLLVRPDGTIGLRAYGAVQVAGLTTDEAARQIRDVLATKFECPSESVSVRVSVVTFRTPHAWIITHLDGQEQKLYSRRLTGSETVVDAVASVDGLPARCGKCRMWLERPAGGQAAGPEVLLVDWWGITRRASTTTNYTLRDGDRIYVGPEPAGPRQPAAQELLEDLHGIPTILLR
jgi:protein involved in polysaccharide export with SLBB domain